MEITLQINGRSMSFQKNELEAIVEKHLANKTNEVMDIIRHTEGEWFKVKTTAINFGIFDEERCDVKQETTRQIILQAFEEMQKNPKLYARTFYTIVPICNTSKKRKIYELEEYAHRYGDHIADWVEQALEWAQRISNGETWEDICNRPDVSNCYRMVEWKNGHYHLVGGSKQNNDTSPATQVSPNYFKYAFCSVSYVEPLIVKYI